jgi:hypothetical protein
MAVQDGVSMVGDDLPPENLRQYRSMTTATKTGRAPARAAKKRTPLVRRVTREGWRRLAGVALAPGRESVVGAWELTQGLRQFSQPEEEGAVVTAAGSSGLALSLDLSRGIPIGSFRSLFPNGDKAKGTEAIQPEEEAR